MPANEYPKQELAQLRIGLKEVSQADRIEFHNFCRIDRPSTHQAGAAREHIEFARKVTGLMQAQVNLTLGGRKHGPDSALQDYVEMAPDRPLIEKDLSRGYGPADAHPRKPGNLLVVELGICRALSYATTRRTTSGCTQSFDTDCGGDTSPGRVERRHAVDAHRRMS